MEDLKRKKSPISKQGESNQTVVNHKFASKGKGGEAARPVSCNLTKFTMGCFSSQYSHQAPQDEVIDTKRQQKMERSTSANKVVRKDRKKTVIQTTITMTTDAKDAVTAPTFGG